MNAKKMRGVPSWVWWLLGLTAIGLVISGIFEGKETVKGNSASKIRVGAKVIVLKPGKTITLEINDKEWSPWIDASRIRKGIIRRQCCIHVSRGVIFMFRGYKRTVTIKEKSWPFPPGTPLVYKLKSLEGSQQITIKITRSSVVEGICLN